MVIGWLVVGVGLAEETDPVLEYYWTNAGKAAPVFNPNKTGVSYQFRATSWRRSRGDNEEWAQSDSLVRDFFVSNGSIDSVLTIKGEPDRFDDLSFFHPEIFELDFHLGLFPNDTGGAPLAISMMYDSASVGQPDGLVVIDRYQYNLRSLYLYFPGRSGYLRFTQSWRFTVIDGLVFPDSVWEVGTKMGVFSTDSYRLETGITDILVRQAADRTEP